jgi:hypothetical protein
MRELKMNERHNAGPTEDYGLSGDKRKNWEGLYGTEVLGLGSRHRRRKSGFSSETKYEGENKC